jgi:hypothetical protein
LPDNDHGMSYADALNFVIAATGIERYRWLCSEENPDIEQREGYRAYVIRQALGLPEPVPGITPTPDERRANPGCCGQVLPW